MNPVLLLQVFMTTLLFMGCEEITSNIAPSENFNEPAPLKDDGVLEKIEIITAPTEEKSPQILDIGSSLFRYPNGGFMLRGGGGNQNACARIEGDFCQTGKPAPFNEGKIFCAAGNQICKPNAIELVYYLYIEDFIDSFIEIPTSNVSVNSSTIASSYLAGRAPVYNSSDIKSGTCSASFLSMQNQDGIFTDIANYLSVDNGLIVTWFTPTTLINLELDSIVHGMVTECLVVASTKVGVNPFYGDTFNMVVSSDDEKIYFELTRLED